MWGRERLGAGARAFATTCEKVEARKKTQLRPSEAFVAAGKSKESDAPSMGSTSASSWPSMGMEHDGPAQPDESPGAMGYVAHASEEPYAEQSALPGSD